jgi:hypothetical protein
VGCSDDSQTVPTDMITADSRADVGSDQGTPDLAVDQSTPDQQSGKVTLVLGFVEGTPITPAPRPVRLPGATVTLYEVSDLTKPLGTGTTDAQGEVSFTTEVTSGTFVAHATKTGYRDTWWFDERPTFDGKWGNIPVVSEAEWQSALTTAGQTEVKGNGVLGTFGRAGGDLSSLVTTVSSGGKTFYLNSDGKIDTTLTSGASSATINVPPGKTTVKLEGSGTALKGQRDDVAVFADALTVVMVPVN